MHTSRPLVTVLACLFLAVASPLVLADPGGGKGQGHSKQGAQDDRGQGNREGHGKGKKPAADDWSHGPSIDRGNVLGILGGHRDYWSRDRRCLPVSRRTWPVASPFHQASPRSWTAGCSGNCHAMRGMSGGRPVRT